MFVRQPCLLLYVVRQRVCMLSDNPRLASSTLFEKYKLANAHPVTLQLLDEPAAARTQCVRPTPSLLPCMREAVVCRFHPTLRICLNRAIQAVPPPAGLNMRLLPAWKNALPSIGSLASKSVSICRVGRREGSLCVSNFGSQSSSLQNQGSAPSAGSSSLQSPRAPLAIHNYTCKSKL